MTLYVPGIRLSHHAFPIMARTPTRRTMPAIAATRMTMRPVMSRNPRTPRRAGGTPSIGRPWPRSQRCVSPSSAPAGRLLRCRPPARERGSARRGRHDRAAPDAMGSRPPRGRARPSPAEDRLARVREDRCASGLSLLRERGSRTATSRTRSSRRSMTPWSTRSARRPIGASASPARIFPGPGRPPSSSPGTTATRTSSTSSSTSPTSARSSSGTATSPSTSRGCSR